MNIFCNMRLITGERVLENTWMAVDEKGIIVRTAAQPQRTAGENIISLGNALVVPGFVDGHIHGFGPFDFEDPACDLDGAAALLFRHGVTCFLPTCSPCAPDGASLARPHRLCSRTPGLHLEGPFLSARRPGGFFPGQIRPYTRQAAAALLSAYEGQALLVTAAPEAVCLPEWRQLSETCGFALSAGHTAADYDTARAAFAGGFRRVTHTLNAMPPLSHRSPSITDAALLDDAVLCEVIADGRHLSLPALRLLLRLKGAERLQAVSDSVCAVGPGLCVRDGLVYHGETIYGSQAAMDDLFRVLLRAGATPDQAVRMTSSNVCRSLGLAGGCLEAGFPADFAVLSPDLSVTRTYVGGRCVWAAA